MKVRELLPRFVQKSSQKAEQPAAITGEERSAVLKNFLDGKRLSCYSSRLLYVLEHTVTREAIGDRYLGEMLAESAWL